MTGSTEVPTRRNQLPLIIAASAVAAAAGTVWAIVRHEDSVIERGRFDGSGRIVITDGTLHTRDTDAACAGVGQRDTLRSGGDLEVWNPAGLRAGTGTITRGTAGDSGCVLEFTIPGTADRYGSYTIRTGGNSLGTVDEQALRDGRAVVRVP
ncbi:hypothetical protein CFN78_17810 [Amycolatopsis antarctica]|uniref:Uncharacterized protein n=1 Tax=Amycolatopsis antarctica TaxID=1854586 RepID=A0A263D0W6_9PSEU|nr:hypothetical protein [Amycolatopsis antarctica]OZM71991.1 hypothetical protein CFN78_17810 [Amycolatopsis antarctica]